MIYFTQGNYGHIINIYVKDRTGSAVPLTGSTVSMDLVFPDKTKKNYSLTVADAASGKAQLVTTTEMTAVVGKLKGYIDVVGLTSRITLDKPFEFTVLADDGGVA